MSWVTGSATDRFDLLTKLIQIATGQGATAVAIQAGGTGYTVGDILDVQGGTFSFRCKIRVTAVSGNVITGAVVAEGGAYTSTPSNPVAVTGPGNDDATFNLTFASNGWTEMRRSKEATITGVSIDNGGSGGTNGAQVVTLGTMGAVGVTTSAQFNVTISGNAITAVNSVAVAGLYEKPPTNPVAVTGAGLSGATLNVNYVAPTAQEQVAILRGTGGGSDQIFVGLRTYTAANAIFGGTARNYSLHGFTAFNDGLTFDAQAGKSPGDPTVATGTLGAYVPLHDSGGSFPLDFWISATPNRITGVVKIRNASVTHYASLYEGFVNRFGSPSEWPYPLYISGCTTRVRALFNSTVETYVSGIVEMIAAASDANGPGWYRRSDGVWASITNSTISGDETGPTRNTTSTNRALFPSGTVNQGVVEIDGDDAITAAPSAANGGFSFSGGAGTNILIPLNNLPGAPDKTLHPTPNTGGALRRLFPVTAFFAVNGPPVEKDVFGELDGVFWVSAADVTTPLTSEDFIDVGTDRYRVFKSGNRALDYTFFALREK